MQDSSHPVWQSLRRAILYQKHPSRWMWDRAAGNGNMLMSISTGLLICYLPTFEGQVLSIEVTLSVHISLEIVTLSLVWDKCWKWQQNISGLISTNSLGLWAVWAWNWPETINVPGMWRVTVCVCVSVCLTSGNGNLGSTTQSWS